ncbi:MAG TPA: hypothetical protein VN282_13505 [Pyrinomonadaceae bacterium]|nr:hypothetical protein [Pyrinomonadaceae bacterium]
MSEKLREGAPDAAAGQGQTQTQAQDAGAAEAKAQAPAPYALAGEAFTGWFNDRVRRLTNPTVLLGTKLARVVGLHQDGRLECEIETEALEPERQFVAFEASYLDQLVRKIAAIGL